MTYYTCFEVPTPRGDGFCSDDDCPCDPIGVRIPRGKGYLYIPQDVVDFRIDCLSWKALEKKCKKLMKSYAKEMKMNWKDITFNWQGRDPILVCE